LLLSIKVYITSKPNGFWHTLKYKAAAVTLGGFENKEEVDNVIFKTSSW
jgi:hypothetical protein